MLRARKRYRGKQNIHTIYFFAHTSNHFFQNQIRTKHKRLIINRKSPITKNPKPILSMD